MRECIRLFLLIVLISGCMSYSTIMVNADGQIEQVSERGRGVVNGAMAKNAFSNRIDELRNYGFQEIKEAGEAGIYFGNDESTIVTKFFPDSPAEKSGIKLGDKITAIDGIEVKNSKQAKKLLFGRLINPVRIVYENKGGSFTVSVARISYNLVNGIKQTK